MTLNLHGQTRPPGCGLGQAAVLEASPTCSRGAGLLAAALQRSDRVPHGTQSPQVGLAWPPVLPGHGRGPVHPGGSLSAEGKEL